MPNIDLSILNQRQTPAFYADVFANRPAAGYVGRIFVSTDTFAFYRDNGTGWDLIGGPGTGTITGSGTAGTVPLWNGASTIGNSTLLEGTTKFTTTKDFQADAFYLNGASAANGALYFEPTQNRVTIANYNAGGIVLIEVNGGNAAQTIAADLSTTFSGNIIRSGGTSNQFLKADGSLDSNTYNTGSGAAGQVSYFNGTNSITGSNDLFWDNVNGHLGVNTNVPGTALDVHHDQNTVAILNQTTLTNDVRIGFQNNGVGLWRIGAFYNAGENDFGIYDAVAAIQPVTVKKTTGQVLIGTSTVGSGKLVVASATGDNGVQIVGATAPSLRIDNAEVGATKRLGIGLSTGFDNFIQGSVDRDFCIFNSSTTASPILFGIYGTINTQEAARISAARNFIVGKNTDSGERLQISGTALITGQSTFSGNNNIFTGGTQGNLNTYPLAIANNKNLVFGSPAAVQPGRMWSGGMGADNLEDISIYSYGNFKINAGSSLTNRLYISGSTGNIGINTITPTSLLTLQGDGVSPLVMTINSANPNCDIFMQSSVSANAVRLRNGADDFSVFTNGSQRTTVTSSGNLLIGTTTDNGNMLQVNGNMTLKSSTIAQQSTNVTTSSVQVATGSGIGVGAFYFVVWFNNSGGSQGNAVLMSRAGSLTTISISDGSGCGVSFSVSGATLFSQTTSGSVTMGVTQINM